IAQRLVGSEMCIRDRVNAAGIWGQRIAEYADLRITMFPAKGSLLILDHRINNLVINRCRKPADADILVPGDTISLIGTTSMHIPVSYTHLTLPTKLEV
ncbi:anaerobic glycerol-3-phosphate dehydrogenase subunit A, partial [Salmonella enterica subsp. enterica serovar Oslo]|nr:anaerobic glycerol-3-phosphate dehydrogenase subunit A [Salmonella enterica subsp. enterica serovar Oslo]